MITRRTVLASAVAAACTLGAAGTAAAAPVAAVPATPVVTAAPSAASLPVLRQGSRGSLVKAVQRTMRLLNHRIAVDGVYGPATGRAVRAFQARNGLPATGVVAAATYRELDIIQSFATEGFPTVRLGDRGEAVRRLQMQLNDQFRVILRRSAPHVAEDGVFGRGTRASVMELQRVKGLRVTGVADQRVWSATWDGFGD